MVHPDYQDTPKLIDSMAYMIANDVYPVALASRILGMGALRGDANDKVYFKSFFDSF